MDLQGRSEVCSPYRMMIGDPESLMDLPQPQFARLDRVKSPDKYCAR
jgi:hypothetical protein